MTHESFHSASDYQLPDEIAGMIRHGKEVRSEGGQAYVDARRDERIADMQGLPGTEADDSAADQITPATPSPQESAERESDEHKRKLASGLGPVAVSKEVADTHNRNLRRIRQQTGF